jgi:hypothetical protein
LERHEKIEQSPDPNDTVHRPPVMHHLYILRRTDLQLKPITRSQICYDEDVALQ